MTKQQIIDTVFNDLRKAKPDVEYPRRLVEFNLGMAWNQILYNTFRKDLSFLGFYAKEYLNVAVTLNGSTGVYSSTLPAAIVQLPDKSAGVRRISRMTEDSMRFVPMSESLAQQKSGLEVDRVTSKIGFIVRYNRVEYDDNMTAAIAAGNVKMSLVIPFDAYTWNENLPIPAGQDEELVRLAMQFMLVPTQTE